MRGYVEHYLGPLAEERGVPEDERRSLISIVESGLRGNPRGVKQFYNDLEARLRLLEEREQTKEGEKPGISPPVSGQVAMVAKLALIEREWPEAFSRLQEDPRLLASWTRAARTRPAIDWDEELIETDAPGAAAAVPTAAVPLPMVPGAMTGATAHRSHREFASFLRIAATVDSPEIRALLSLKQSAVEVELPGFSEFREALLSGDRGELSEILNRADESDREGLAKRVPRLLVDELNRRYFDIAREILGATIDIPELSTYTEVRRQVIGIAADDPELRREMVNLRAAEVLAAGEILELPARQRLLEPYLQRFHDVQAAGERRELARDIASHLDDLSSPQRTTLRAALAAAYREEFANYLPLVEADPELLPHEAVDAALEHLSAPGDRQPQPQEPGPISTRDAAAVRVIQIGLGSGMREDQRQRLVGTVTRIFGAVLNDGELARQDLPILTELIAPVELEDPQSFVDLARTVPARWSEIADGTRDGTIELAGAALSHCGDEVAKEIAQEIAGQLFNNPTDALSVISSMSTVPEPFKEPFIVHLTSWAGRPEDWTTANDVLREVDRAGFPDRAVESFAELFRTGHTEEAVELLKRYRDDLRPLEKEVADTAAPIVLERIQNEAPGPVELLDRVIPRLSPEILAGLASAYAAALDRANGLEVRTTLEELPVKAEHLTQLTAHHSIHQLDVGSRPLLDFISGQIGKLTKEDQEDFAEQIAARLRSEPGQLLNIAPALTRVRNLAAKPATEIVETLLTLDRSLPDPPIRRDLFAASLAMRKRKGTRVDTMLKERLREMATSEYEIDRQLAAEFQEQISD
jgi:hypothetical protein